MSVNKTCQEYLDTVDWFKQEINQFNPQMLLLKLFEPSNEWFVVHQDYAQPVEKLEFEIQSNCMCEILLKINNFKYNSQKPLELEHPDVDNITTLIRLEKNHYRLCIDTHFWNFYKTPSFKYGTFILKFNYMDFDTTQKDD